MSSSRLNMIGLAVAAMAIFALAGCGFGGNDAANQDVVADGSITLYSGRDEGLIQPLVDMFEEESGIKVAVRYGETAEISALILEEGDRSPADVFLSQDAGALGALSEAGLFSELPTNVNELVPAGFTSTDGTWVGITGRARVIAYDSEKLTQAQVPTSVDEFTEPQWKGRFGIAPGNASFQSFVTAYRELKGEAAADEWVAKIAANEPQLFDSNGAILTAVNQGSVDAGLINHYYWFGLADEVGEQNMRAQLAFPAVGDPGSIVNVTGAGIMKSAAKDADALEFVQFLLSEEAQKYFVTETFEYPLISSVESPAGLPELQSLLNPDLDLADLSSLAQTQELLQKYGLI